MKSPSPDRPERQAAKMPFFHPCSRRMHVIALIMFGFFTMNLMRANIGMGMTCMINSTAVALNALSANGNLSDPLAVVDSRRHELRPQTCGGVEEGDGEKVFTDYGGTFDWPASVQGHIFASAFYGTLFTLIPSGILADMWSPVYLLQIAGVFLIVCTGLTPFFADNFGPWSVFGLRFVMGLGEGFILPAINKLVSVWIPNEEKSTAVSMYTSGNQLGGILGVPFFAFLCGSQFGWPAVFYSATLFGLVWIVFWNRLVSSSPAKCKRMSERERLYLESCPELKAMPKNRRFYIPLKAILTSPAFIALMLCNFAVNMVAAIVQIYLPTFLKEVLYVGTVYNGFFSAVPPMAQFFAKLFWSITIDHLKSRGLCPTVAVKISQSITSYGTGIVFVLLSFYANCEHVHVTLALLFCLGLCLATATSGFLTSMVSFAPAYTGIITSISFLFGVIGRSAVTIIVPYFNKTGTLEEWRNVFLVTSAVLFFSGTLFNIFGSGVAQPWGIRRDDESQDKQSGVALQDQEAIKLGSMMLEVAEA